MLVDPYLDLLEATGQGRLSPRLRELAVLLVASHSEVDALVIEHVGIGRRVGLTDDEMAAVSEGDIANPARLAEAERAVLAFTEAVLADADVEPHVFDAVAAELSQREVVELLVTIGTHLGLARLLTVLEHELELDLALEVAPSPAAVIRAVRHRL